MQANFNISLSGNAQPTVFSPSDWTSWASLTPVLSAAAGVVIGLLIATSLGWM